MKQRLSDEHPQVYPSSTPGPHFCVGEFNITYVTTIVSKINAKSVILQESCVLLLLDIISVLASTRGDPGRSEAELLTPL